MALLQDASAIYHHPLDSALTFETVKDIVWTQSGGQFGASKVNDGFLPDGGAGSMTGAGGSYDTTIGSVKLAFTAWTKNPSAIGGDGYALGGFANSVAVSAIDKLDFSTDAVTSTASNLTGIRRIFMGGFASASAGYVCGGFGTTVILTTIDKLTFADDSVALNTSGLTGASQEGVAGFESATAGYACGGFIGGISATVAIEKLTFSNDNVAANSSNLTASRYGGVAGFAGASAGYACGGSVTGNNRIATVEKLTFSNDNVFANSSSLSGTRRGGAGGFESATAGYTCGGNTGAPGVPPGSNGANLSVIDKLAFATDNVAVISSSLTGTRQKGVAGFAGSVAGYACGGIESVTSGAEISTIDKLTFSTDAVAVNASGLTGTRWAGGGGHGGFESSV